MTAHAGKCGFVVAVAIILAMMAIPAPLGAQESSSPSLESSSTAGSVDQFAQKESPVHQLVGGLLLRPCLRQAGSSSSRAPRFAVAALTPEHGETSLCYASLVDADAVAEPIVSSAIEARRPESFHWNSALKESFRFMLLEHGFRIAMDHDARWMLLHKPFWHDYFASFKDSDWGSQWGDGDNFLVNYVGHPLQGAVSSNIYIQNDPAGRALKFGNNRPYWNSRLKAMGWSAVYSLLFESGPVLSETAIGNQGGYMYVPGCGYYPTCEKVPGRAYKPPTNNTGWVDRVVTPVVGTGWLVLEDVLEAKVVDRLAKGSSAKKYKILRGVLAPSHSLSNALAGKLPWYRYPSSVPGGSAILAESVLPRDTRPEWQQEPRWAVGVNFTELSLPVDREGCASCRVYNPGVGLDVEYRLTRLLYFDSEYALFPGSGAAGTKGMMQEGLFGLKFGRRFGSWGLFTQARPGFIHYDKTLVPRTTDRYESVTRFAFDLGGSAEYYASRQSVVRFRLGSTFVRYLKDYPDPNQPPVSVLSSSVIATQGNFYATTGYLFRF